LVDPTGYMSWLGAIARNVCLRWRRRHKQERARIQAFVPDAESAEADDWAVDTFDLEVELERHELADLLDQAMDLLPPATRAVLIARYLDEFPQAEIAVRLGLTEGAVEARLHRGKLALRRLLNTSLREEAAAFGLGGSQGGAWQETRIWCPFCGQRKLVCTVDRDNGEAAFRCRACDRAPGGQISSTQRPELVHGVSSPRAILSRQIAWLDRHYREALADTDVRCLYCGQTTRVETRLPDFVPPSLEDSHGMQIVCSHCGLIDANPLQYLVLDLPATQRFWREHGRMRVLPEREVEVDGRPAIVTSYESVTESARLDVISTADTLAVLGVHRVDGPERPLLSHR